MLGRECPVELPDRAVHLPTFSHLVIVNKLLSLSFSRVCVSHTRTGGGVLGAGEREVY
jgi:hypothetical protein